MSTSKRKRQSKGGDGLSSQQLVQQDWTEEAHSVTLKNAKRRKVDVEDAMDVDDNYEPSTGKRGGKTPSRKPTHGDDDDDDDDDNQEDTIAAALPPPPSRRVSASRSKRRESGLHQPLRPMLASRDREAEIVPSPAHPSMLSILSPSPHHHSAAAARRSALTAMKSPAGVTQRLVIQFDPPATPPASARKKALPTATPKSVSAVFASSSSAQDSANEHEGAAKQSAANNSSVLLVLALLILVLVRLAVFPVTRKPSLSKPSSLQHGRSAFLLAPSLSGLSQWLTLRSTSGPTKDLTEGHDHPEGAYIDLRATTARLFKIEAGINQHNLLHARAEELSANTTRTFNLASTVHASYKDLDAELTRIVADAQRLEREKRNVKDDSSERPEVDPSHLVAQAVRERQASFDGLVAKQAERLRGVEAQLDSDDIVKELESAVVEVNGCVIELGLDSSAQVADSGDEIDAEVEMPTNANLEEVVRLLSDESLKLEQQGQTQRPGPGQGPGSRRGGKMWSGTAAAM